MSKPEILIPFEFVTKDILRQTAKKAIQDMQGPFSETDIFNAVRDKALESNLLSLLDETAWSITKEEVKRQARPRLTDSSDWIGYGEMLIKLPEGRAVKVVHATMNDLNVRRNNVKENLAIVTASSEAELKRIDTLEQTMKAHDFSYAGQAIDCLEKRK